MTKELINATHLQAIRLLSGLFDPNDAVTTLAFVNLIARHAKKQDNDFVTVDDNFFDEQMAKLGLYVRD
jgi:hypothetical protein